MADILYKKTGDIFNQHSYWTKQPVDAITHYIESYTKKNDVVLDPFCGSGMTGLAAKLTGREAILGDLSPAAVHISKGFNLEIDFSKDKLDLFLEKISKEIGGVYKTECIHCKEEADIRYEIIGETYLMEDGSKFSEAVEVFNSIKNKTEYRSRINHKIHKFNGFEPIKYCYICPCSKNKIFKDLDDRDQQKLEKIKKIKRNFPNYNFFGKESKRNLKKNIFKVKDLYSDKNLFALNKLLELIKNEANGNFYEFLMFNFSAIIFNCSLMSRYREYENTSIKMGTYYVPATIKDNNVLISYTRKAQKNFEAKTNLMNLFKSHSVKIAQMDATSLKSLKDESIDFIYTDPPYVDIINYSELNLVWEAWLSIHIPAKNEMIVCKEENKSLDYYYDLFAKFFSEAARVLKKGSYMVVIFHHPNIDYWGRLQKLILASNFIIEMDDTPVRLISQNKTSSQHKTNKNTQSFMGIVLKKQRTQKRKAKDLPRLKKSDVESIKKLAAEQGFLTSSEQYDYLINYCMNRYDLSTLVLE
jgi:DNA modification methylase